MFSGKDEKCVNNIANNGIDSAEKGASVVVNNDNMKNGKVDNVAFENLNFVKAKTKDNEMTDSRDEYFMNLAILQAKKAEKKGEVPIGAIVVCGDKVIAKAHNLRQTTKNAIAHAEILALKKASKKLKTWHLVDCELYVTLEPCPMCSGAIINSRIKRVIFGAYDPKAGCCGSLYNLPLDKRFNHRPEAVQGGVLEKECASLLSDFFKSIRNKR